MRRGERGTVRERRAPEERRDDAGGGGRRQERREKYSRERRYMAGEGGEGSAEEGRQGGQSRTVGFHRDGVRTIITRIHFSHSTRCSTVTITTIKHNLHTIDFN